MFHEEGGSELWTLQKMLIYNRRAGGSVNLIKERSRRRQRLFFSIDSLHKECLTFLGEIWQAGVLRLECHYVGVEGKGSQGCARNCVCPLDLTNWREDVCQYCRRALCGHLGG